MVLAYQVVGTGSTDLVFVPGWISNIEMAWELPSSPGSWTGSQLDRLIWFDKRGTGLSNRVSGGHLEERADDIRAVMDAAGCRRAALVGWYEGGAIAANFAATYRSGSARWSSARSRRGRHTTRASLGNRS